jgi:hypothetical protein
MDSKLESKIEKISKPVENSLDRESDWLFAEPIEQQKNSIENNLDYTVVGNRYYWNLTTEESKNFQDFRDNSSPTDKKIVSQTLGESHGHQFVTDVLKYDTILDPISKFDSFPQGFDAVYRDRNGEIVVAEFKGQNASESAAQKRISWTSEVCDRIVNPRDERDPYSRAGDTERALAHDIRTHLDRGNVRYEVIHTKFDSTREAISSAIVARRNASEID